MAEDDYLAAALAAEEAVKKEEGDASEDRLTRLRRSIALTRAKLTQLAALTEATTRLKKELNELEFHTLVDGMAECKISYMELEAEDDFPAVSANLKQFESAKIPEGGEVAAFDYLAAEGFADSIKNTITVSSASPDVREAILNLCDETATDFEEKRSVHGQTLLKIVRELYKSRRLVDTDEVKPSVLIGAYVGQCVKLKVEK